MIVALLEAAVIEALPRFVDLVGTRIAKQHQPSAEIEVFWKDPWGLTVWIYLHRFGRSRLISTLDYPLPGPALVPALLHQVFQDLEKRTRVE